MACLLIKAFTTGKSNVIDEEVLEISSYKVSLVCGLCTRRMMFVLLRMVAKYKCFSVGFADGFSGLLDALELEFGKVLSRSLKGIVLITLNPD